MYTVIFQPFVGYLHSIETATFLSEEQKLDLYYNNAVEFLRL
jgi:hypothetical protein